MSFASVAIQFVAVVYRHNCMEVGGASEVRFQEVDQGCSQEGMLAAGKPVVCVNTSPGVLM